MAFNPAIDVGPMNPSSGGGGGNMLGSLLLGGLGGLGNFFAAQAQAKAQKEAQQRQIAADAARQNQQIAYGESQLDPFRQQMMQGRNLSMLDMKQNYQPTQQWSPLQPGQTREARGPSYAPSPELLSWLSALKTNVAGGQNQAPTMTNPANYGQTSALDLVSLGMGNGTGDRDPYYAQGANRRR
jgi:hypothetical protein